MAAVHIEGSRHPPYAYLKHFFVAGFFSGVQGKLMDEKKTRGRKSRVRAPLMDVLLFL
jgi:hypothetical protein